MTEIKYKGCLHGNFYRVNVKDSGINGFVDGYVDVFIDKKTGRISVHGVEKGATPRIVVDLEAMFNGPELGNVMAAIRDGMKR